MENTFKPETIPSYIPRILDAMPVTIEILLISLILSLLLGAALTCASLSRRRWLNGFAAGYIAFMRGIPTLILIFLLYLALPQVTASFGLSLANVSKVAFIIATLSLSFSANMAEMMRSAYLAVDKGQREAAYSVGMTPFTAFRRIIFPQAFAVAIPVLGNNIIMLFKETSLAFSIGVLDILGRARAISAASYGANRLEVYIACGLIFWVICIALEQLTRLAERCFTKGRRKASC